MKTSTTTVVVALLAGTLALGACGAEGDKSPTPGDDNQVPVSQQSAGSDDGSPSPTPARGGFVSDPDKVHRFE
ncbi:hypothetical protein MWU75_17280 [Ornithinimicrobium sp. F0845]|uniref:hypothetical protein n=1 Tax=Ornithinimicrobium sp. F0845 TaxID=2926412 RepID=UPI001FF69893|nr:hypothetical protein [Ornithinimicrobium sp. F0845]MCK0113900.1 hypothetical protein [Ornithinimicrobium sp. F0845]